MLICMQYHSDDSDPDEPAYFTASAPLSHSYSPSRSRRRHDSEHSFPSPPPKAPSPPAHQLILKRPDSILEVISQEWTKEGGWGVWKGSNTTFVYSVLVQTLEKWSRGLLSALLNVPDPDLTTGLEMSAELIGSPYPWASLGVAIAAAVATGIILAPLDLIRTKYYLPLFFSSFSSQIVANDHFLDSSLHLHHIRSVRLLHNSACYLLTFVHHL
jgi:fusion and transport protein UGO1